MRRDHFINAYTELQALITKINNAQELFPISGGSVIEWMTLINTELRLLRGVMKSDKQRYKRFYPDDDQDKDENDAEQAPEQSKD